MNTNTRMMTKEETRWWKAVIFFTVIVPLIYLAGVITCAFVSEVAIWFLALCYFGGIIVYTTFLVLVGILYMCICKIIEIWRSEWDGR